MKLKVFIVYILVIITLSIVGCSQRFKENNNSISNEAENTKEAINEASITEKDAINLVKNYLSKNNQYIGSNIEVEGIDGDNYLVHVYDIINNEEESHTATVGWFEVNIYTGEIIDIINS